MSKPSASARVEQATSLFGKRETSLEGLVYPEETQRRGLSRQRE